MGRKAELCVTALTLISPIASQQAIYTLDGNAPGDVLGMSVDCAGDVDADGTPDIIAGANRASTINLMAGEALVYSGASGAVIHTFRGEFAGDQLGRSVSRAGDVNGDGFADVIVGATGTDYGATDGGSAYVFSGRDGYVIHRFDGPAVATAYAVAVAGVGDVNGDGYDDLAVGARLHSNANGHHAGTVFVYSGATGQEIYRLFGPNRGDQLGHSVAGAGDVNADGFDDIIAGAYMADPNGSMSGQAIVFDGRTGSALHYFDGEFPRDWFGISVGGAGDVNFDGFADLIVGAMWNDSLGPDSGMARVFSGLDGTEIHTFYGNQRNDFFGCSVRGAGDVDGDGFADLVVGAYGDDTHGSSCGTARVFSGIDGREIQRFHGTADNDVLGLCVSGGEDIDGDGLADVLAGCTGFDGNGRDSGRVFVFDCGGVRAAGRAIPHGAGCVGSGQRMPRLLISAAPAVGRSMMIALRGATPSAVAALHVGHAVEHTLDSFGLTGCTSYVEPVAAFRAPTSPTGLVRLPLWVPNDPTIIGLSFNLQWAVDDPNAPRPIGAALSAGVRVEVGR